jgi:hypothetical protein
VLGALIAAGAVTSASLAWSGTAVAVLLVALALAVGCAAPIPWSLALLGVVFLLDGGHSLVLAPIYGAGLLVVGELAQCSIDLRRVTWMTPGWVASRLAAILALAALGAGAGALAAAAATVAAARSATLTAAGGVAAVTALGTITLLARRGHRVPADAPSGAPDPQTSDAP